MSKQHQQEALTPAFFERHWPLERVQFGAILREEDWRRRMVKCLKTPRGLFVYKVTRYGTAGTDPDSAFVLDFLAEKGFAHSPRLVYTLDGARSARADDLEIIVMEYVEGTRPKPSPENYRKLGEVLGKLNKVTDYPFDWRITLKVVRPSFEKIARRLTSDADRNSLMRLAEDLSDIDALPRSLIHGEMNLDNTIRQPDGSLVAVDWDAAGNGARVLDPASLMISSFVSEELVFDGAGADAFFGSYLSAIDLSDSERGSIFDAALFHAIRSIEWANSDARWHRIQWAVEHKDEFMLMVSK